MPIPSPCARGRACRHALVAAVFLLGALAAPAQETRFVSFDPAFNLTWTNDDTNAHAGFQTAPGLGLPWIPANAWAWNFSVTSPVMSVDLAAAKGGAAPFYIRLVHSTNTLSRGETFTGSVTSLPQFMRTNYVELDKIASLSRFRSSAGHDNSDDFESCRSMKHYFMPKSGLDAEQIRIFSPVNGMLYQIQPDGGGVQVRIKADEQPGFYFRLYHVVITNALRPGDRLSAGQAIGHAYSGTTATDIEVDVNATNGWRLVSYFDVMTDSLFSNYQARGVASRTNLIITKEQRDADPLTCDGQTFLTNGTLASWVTLL
jgi:hypothetical protein